MENALDINRTPELIAEEINLIKNQTKVMVIYNTIEIGRKLTEAKSKIPHGEWGKWLEEKVDCSKSTANNLMRIFEEYGSEQMALFGETPPKFQALGNLGYSQLVAMLSVPEEEREDFINENEVENLSTRELEKLIKERDQERKAKEEAIAAKEEAEKKERVITENYEELAAANRKYHAEVAELNKQIEVIKNRLADAESAAGDQEEIDCLQNQLQEATEKITAANTNIEELKKQLQEKPIDVTPIIKEVVPPEVEDELERLRAELNKGSLSAAETHFKVRLEVLAGNFNELLAALDDIGQDKKEKYKAAIRNLACKITEQIE